jgi:protein-S-isoprenylcysteine O-methyltransferase Ste14
VTRSAAAVGSALFFVLAPGIVAGLIPWALTGWQADTATPLWPVAVIVGSLLVVSGVAVLVHAFVRFVVEGVGTPAPVAPTEQLVVGGLYRYVRNPMYLAVLSVIVGQALILGRAALWIYALVVAAAFVTFVKAYEEPTLAARYGEAYERYRREVPGWIPRLRPTR